VSNLSTVIGSKEILLVAENIAHSKAISKQKVIEAIQEGIEMAAKKKYGYNLLVECEINQKTGHINIYNNLLVVEDENVEDFDSRTQIPYELAKEKDEDAIIDGYIRELLPPIDLNRTIAKITKNEVIKKVKEAEKEKEYEEFKDRVGDIAYATVKKVGIKNILMDVDNAEAIIHQDDLLPKEMFKVGDKLRVYIKNVEQQETGVQIFLSRTHEEFLVKLFAQEVPELFDGSIKVGGVARDPGSRAKIAVYSDREDIDVVGSLIGVRGTRVQSISAELRGEKIDVIKWSNNLPEVIIEALAPAKISKVIIDEENDIIDAVLNEDQISLAIGRSGQNVRLASKLMGYKINVLTEDEESNRRKEEFKDLSELFAEILDVDTVIAQLLIVEGFSSIEDIASSELSDIASIEGFNEDIAEEIIRRANEHLEPSNQQELSNEESQG
jgi:transcription termination/antitermination protein NusA